MSVTVLGVDGNPFDQNSVEIISGRTLRTYNLLKLSGSYLTGGDVLDLSNGGGTLAAPSAIPAAQSRGLVSVDIRPICKTTTSFSAADGQYYVLSAAVPITGAALLAMKLKLMLDIAVEYSAGAYGTDALADIIIAELTWLR